MPPMRTALQLLAAWMRTKSGFPTMLLPLRAVLQGFPTASLHPADCRSRLECPCFDLAGNPAWDATISRLNQMPNGMYFGCGVLRA